MDANSMLARHWEDVVFEYRNKAYGAYLLRRDYSQRLLVGLGTTLMIVALVLSLQRIYSGDGIAPVVAPPVAHPGHKLSDPPIFEREPRTTTTRPPRVNTQNRPIIVTRDVVDQPQEEAIRDYVADDTGTGDVGTFDGDGPTAITETLPAVEPAIRDFAEVMPSYDGGLEAMMKFIQKKIRYPRAPRQLGIDGTVYVRFVVNGDGSISGVEIMKGVHPDYDKEAMRVVSMLPSWKGGSHNGRPVAVRMVLPIKFSLRNQ